jgi:type II secretory pathway component PulJ
MKREAGVTLMEVLIAVTLLSLLSAGMLMALRTGLNTFSRVDSRLMDNRRVAGAQRIVEQQLQGMMPVVSPCGTTPVKMAFFQGEPQVMRLVSAFSLQQAWRGQPQILELFVIPGENGRGVRLVVNELLYTGPASAAQLCLALVPHLETGQPVPRFAPVAAKPTSFVLADQLSYCRFSYQTLLPDPKLPAVWSPTWTRTGWPMAIRIDMAPLDPDPARLQPISVTSPVRILRSPLIDYVDF